MKIYVDELPESCAECKMWKKRPQARTNAFACRLLVALLNGNNGNQTCSESLELLYDTKCPLQLLPKCKCKNGEECRDERD